MSQIVDTRHHYDQKTIQTLIVSDTKKLANNSALAKDYMDYYDMASGIDAAKIKKIQENYEIHSGRWPEIELITPSLNINIGGENIVLGTGNLNHYPIIDRVSKSVVSDLQIRPIIPIIRDNSSKARNFRERLRLEKVQSFYYNTFIKPRLDQITMEYDMQNGIKDVVSLPIEAQKQRRFDIEQRFKRETPEEVLAIMEKTSTPDELLGQELLKEAMRHTKAKRVLRTGSESAVVTGEEYYRVGIHNDLPYIKWLNAKWVAWGGSEGVINAEDGQFASYTNYLTPEDAVTKHSTLLEGKDLKQIARLFSQVPGTNEYNRSYSNDGIQREIVKIFRDNPQLQNEINPRTLEGQNKLRNLYANLGHNIREGYGIKETYVTWRWLRKVKFVTRIDSNGNLDTFVRSEHYRKDPLAGDIEVIERAIPQAWEGTKLADEFYIGVGPIPYQYSDLDNPFDVKLGIYGGKYSTAQNNVRNNSLIDLAKPWQYRYNVQMKKMEEHQATDLGKIFLGTTTMLPKGWTWSQWYRSVFIAKTAIVSTHKEGINSMDADIFKSIDMSRAVDIGNDIKQLEYLENKIISSMYSSPEKIGNISEYATNQNTQIAIQGVDRQMYSFHERSREIRENVLNALLKVAMFVYKDNESVKSIVLSDFLRAHYEQNFEFGDAGSLSVTLVDDFQESEKLNQMRQLALTFLQNGMTGSQLAALFDAESIPEMRQFLEEVDRKREKQTQEEFQRQESLIEKQRQAAETQLLLQQEFQAAEAERERQVKLRVAEFNASMNENAMDVDRNKINDSLEQAILRIQSDERIKAAELKSAEKIAEMKDQTEQKKIKASKATKK